MAEAEADATDSDYCRVNPADLPKLEEESWMRDEKEACAALTPMEFCFPGSHDSAACKMVSPALVDGGLSGKIAKRARNPLVKRVRDGALIFQSYFRNLFGFWVHTTTLHLYRPN